MFGDDALIGILRSIRAKTAPDFSSLQNDLRELAECYLIVACSTPLGLTDGHTNKSRDERKRELQANYLNPANRIIEALGSFDANLSGWPDRPPVAGPNKDVLVKELHAIVNYVEGIVAALDDRKLDRTPTLTEFKLDLANGLTLVFGKHFPDFPSTLDGYDKTNGPKSPYFAFVQMCAEEIFPNDNLINANVIERLFK
jgi:hypothetical protein